MDECMISTLHPMGRQRPNLDLPLTGEGCSATSGLRDLQRRDQRMPFGTMIGAGA